MKTRFDKILGAIRDFAVKWADIDDKPSNLITGTGTASQIPVFTGVGSETTPLDVEEIPYGFNLSSYSNQNYSYDLTAAAAPLTFNTLPLQLLLNRAGSWKITVGFVVEYVNATFAANQTIATKLRRTNNTAADITNSNPANFTLDIVTNKTGGICNIMLPVVIYSTINANDYLQIFANLSSLPSSGSVRVKSAFILAEFLY